MHRERKIGVFLATMLVTSNMVGSGIFLLPATLAQFGSLTSVGWVIATLGALLVARVLGRLGRHAPEPGGACTYAHALGPYIGFQATAIYWVSCWSGNIAIAVAAIGYLATFFPHLAAPRPLALASIVLVWLFTLLNWLGPRLVCQVESATLFAGLIPIALVIFAGLWRFDPAIFAHSWNVSGRPALAALPPSLVLMFWAFAGVESASIATAVVENPERNVARASMYGVLFAAAIYLASCGILMGLIPARQLALSTAPFADAVRLLLGPAAAALVALLALVKAAGSLGGWILLTAQTAEAGATRSLFPPLFARRDRRGVLRANLLVAGVLMSLGVVATLSPTLGEQFGELISVSVLLMLLLYIYACLALWRQAAPAANRRDHACAAAAIFFCAAVIVLSGARMLAWTAAVVALTVPAYWLLRRPRPAPVPNI